jgi:hypothetical protein
MASDVLAERCWRHQRIVRVWHEIGGWAFNDDQCVGTTFVDDCWGVEPRVGERVSYYGRFGDCPYTLGHPIEQLVIGERLVWNLPSEYHA